MVYLRSISFFVVITLIGLVLLPVILLAHLVMKKNYRMKYAIAKFYAKSYISLLKIICKLDFQVHCEISLPQGPAVVLSNHQSFWDNIIILLLFPMQTWVIKQELLDIPVFGWGLKIMNPICVNRTDCWSVNKILTVGQQKIKDGLWVVIFPESTRVAIDLDKKFKPSGVKLASISKVPIVLMTHNAGLFWPSRSIVIKPGTIQIILGPVIEYPDYKAMTTKELNDFVESLITRRKKLLLSSN